MVDMGFSHTNRKNGSEHIFTPFIFEVTKSLLHDRHVANIGLVYVRRFGRQMSHDYGWDYNTFVCGK